MDIVCASSGMINLEHPEKGITGMKDAGFKNILLDMALCCPADELKVVGREQRAWMSEAGRKNKVSISEHPEEMHKCWKLLTEQCKKEDMGLPAARAPYLCFGTKREDLRGLVQRLAKESIKTCGQAGCRYLIIRPLSAGIEHGEEWSVNRQYYLRLAEHAKEQDVMILLVNQCRDINGHLVRGICSEADEAAAWVDGLNRECGEERFGFCMDTGICSICRQDVQAFAMVMGSRIKAVILRDCDGVQEASMLPFTGVGRGSSVTDWLGIIRGLREICFDGLLIMDFSATAGAFSGLLRPQLLRFAKATAEYLKWQIGMKNVMKKYNSRVLFGAGNMCRNYMKCYGEEFPPLFTCDNNRERWGTKFEGLLIRPPEALKELPADCAVFICNIYYGEIKQQLREMGLPNPIEYFNDEYMPSYYQDRLEYWKGE